MANEDSNKWVCQIDCVLFSSPVCHHANARIFDYKGCIRI